MQGAATPASPPDPPPPRREDRLDSWKEIAEYLRRGVRTVRRWEKEEALPVHRHLHQRQGGVYAYKSELDTWWDARPVTTETEADEAETAIEKPASSAARRFRRRTILALVLPLTAALLVAYLLRPPEVQPSHGSDGRAMVVVLPFRNLTGDAGQEFFSDGLTEELIGELSRLHPGALGVIARTSAMHYKDAAKRADEIGHELGVDYIVEGSVRREDDRVRVTAQLIRVSDQTHLWAQHYDRVLDGPLAVQRDVARAVATEIQTRLPAPALTRTTGRASVTADAHEAYLKGRYFLEQRTPESLTTARKWFERAIAVQPDYAAAFVGLADTHILSVTYADATPTRAMEQARRAVQQALALDGRLPEAHAWLGIILTEYDWNWSAADREFRRAIELDPNFAYAHKLRAEYLSYIGLSDEAIAEARLARRLDPLSVVTNSTLAIVLYRARRYEESLEPATEAAKLSPNHSLPHLALGLSLAQLDRYEQATSALERARSLAADNAEMVAQLGYVHARAGRVKEAIHALSELAARARTGYVPSFHFAIVHAGLGETDRAMDWLEQGFQQRSWLLCVLASDPIFDPLRSNPRFQSLLRRMNFPRVLASTVDPAPACSQPWPDAARHAWPALMSGDRPCARIG